MCCNSAFPDLGALITYDANLDDMNDRAATYVDKLLKGAKLAADPVSPLFLGRIAGSVGIAHHSGKIGNLIRQLDQTDADSNLE